MFRLRSILAVLCFASSAAMAADEKGWFLANSVADRGPGMAGLCSGVMTLEIKGPQEQDDCDGSFEVLFYADLKTRRIYWSKSAAQRVNTQEWRNSSIAVLSHQLKSEGKLTLEQMRAFHLGDEVASEKQQTAYSKPIRTNQARGESDVLPQNTTVAESGKGNAQAVQKEKREENPFYYGLLDISRENLGVARGKAVQMAEESMLKCRNVLLAGPVGASFAEAHMLSKANLSDNPKMQRIVSKQINDGIDCRKAWPSGWSCVGVAYMNTTKAELFRPQISGFEKHGATYGDYVQALTNVRFKSGQTEQIAVFAQKKNIKCIGSDSDAGMFSGLRWQYSPQ